MTTRGGAWSVVSPAPETGEFWLHRWVDGEYETAKAHVSKLSRYRAPAR